MVVFSGAYQYFIFTKSIDMRKGYDGLSGLVKNEMGANPTNGSVYVFFNGPRDKVKMLVWDVDGYVIYAKRLEKGRFEQIIQKNNDLSYSIPFNQLMMLLDGISIANLKQKKRYLLTKSA